MNKYKLVLMLLLITLAALTACSNGGGTDRFTVHIQKTGEGQVSPAVGTYNYAKNKKLSLSATPAENFQFKEWQGSVKGSAAKQTIAVDSKMRIKAIFVEDPAPKWLEQMPQITVDKSNNRIDLKVALNESGIIYYILIKSSAEQPSAQNVKQGVDAAGNEALKKGSFSVLNDEVVSKTLDFALQDQSYQMYVVGEDKKGNLQNEIISHKIDFSNQEAQAQHYQFTKSEEKQIDLGTIAADEEAVVAVTPLNLSTKDDTIYNAAVDINYASGQQNNSVGNLSQQSNKEAKPSAQAVMDARLRQKEKELLELERDNNLAALDLSQQSYQTGDTKEFYDALDEYGSPTTAVLEKISERTLIYVEEGKNLPSSLLDDIATAYDNNIYHKIVNNFGGTNVSDYDWDNNDKMTILITDMRDYNLNYAAKNNSMLAGYFHSKDWFPQDSYQTSNYADMMYINYQFVKEIADGKRDLSQVLGTVAHEFQHLIYFVEKFQAGRSTDDLWINEGFSGLAEYLAGYNNLKDSDKITSFYFGSPTSESLFYWDEYDNSILGDYGGSMLFAYYLYNRFGPGIIKDINSSSDDVVEVINSQLSEGDFNDLFLDWLLANQIYSQDNLKEQYQYPIDFGTTPLYQEVNGTVADDFTVRSTAVKYFKIKGDGSEVTLELNLSSDTGIATYIK